MNYFDSHFWQPIFACEKKGSKKGKRRLSDVHALPFNASTSMMKNGESNDSDMIDDHDDESNTSIEQQSTLSDTSLENQQQKEESGYCAEPFAVLYGHESKVTDMAECVYDYTPSVCSGMLFLVVYLTMDKLQVVNFMGNMN